MADLRNLRVYEAAEDLAANIDRAAALIETLRAPGLRSQMQRAAESIPANLAEGAGLRTDPQLLRGVHIALGSANELGQHLVRAKKRGALDPITVARCESKRVVVCKMLSSLAQTVERRIANRIDAERPQ
jgi:four helix bundle protein